MRIIFFLIICISWSLYVFIAFLLAIISRIRLFWNDASCVRSYTMSIHHLLFLQVSSCIWWKWVSICTHSVWIFSSRGSIHKSNPNTDLDRLIRFQEVEAPRFQDNRHMKVVRLSAVRTPPPLPPRNYSWYSYLLGDRSSTVVKVLCYKSEGRWLDPSWCQWIFHLHKIIPIVLWPWGRLSL